MTSLAARRRWCATVGMRWDEAGGGGPAPIGYFLSPGTKDDGRLCFVAWGLAGGGRGVNDPDT